jgi:hypothetical protein
LEEVLHLLLDRADQLVFHNTLDIFMLIVLGDLNVATIRYQIHNLLLAEDICANAECLSNEISNVIVEDPL